MPKIRTRRFRFLDCGEEGIQEFEMSEQDILNRYWNHWREGIYRVDNANTRKIRNLPLSLQCDACIEDFIVVHWAYEVKDDNTA